MPFAIYNGNLIDESQANISIKNQGYFFDFAVYDSLKTVQGKILFPEYHVDRLIESAQLMDLGHSFTKEQILNWLELLVTKNQTADALLRIVLIGDVDKNQDAQLYIIQVTGLTYYPNTYYSQGVKVITYHGERSLPQCKSKNLLLGFLALREAKKRGAIEALLIDHDGNIREGSRSNFFAIKANTIISPPTVKILSGITRKILLGLTAGHFKIEEKDIALNTIKNYHELFITSTSQNVLPIRQIDEVEIASSFPQTKKLQKLFKEYYQKNVLKI